jgi:hypothetical protein
LCAHHQLPQAVLTAYAPALSAPARQHGQKKRRKESYYSDNGEEFEQSKGEESSTGRKRSFTPCLFRSERLNNAPRINQLGNRSGTSITASAARGVRFGRAANVAKKGAGSLPCFAKAEGWGGSQDWRQHFTI